MKHLVVVAHPAPESFTMQLARAYADELESLEHEAHLRDLYRMGFDPILTAPELAPPDTLRPPRADVAAAQDDIRTADVLTVLYPLWWMAMPAMMKGYIDRVFARGFAYESSTGIVHGLLGGKKALLVTVSGAPLPVLIDTGRWDAARMLQDTHIFRSSGFELIEHLHFDEVAPHLPETRVEDHIGRIRDCARRHFSVA